MVIVFIGFSSSLMMCRIQRARHAVQRSKRPPKLVLVAALFLLLVDVLDGRVAWSPHLTLGTPVEATAAVILFDFGGAGKRRCFLPVKGTA